MSELIVQVCEIDKVERHFNADALDIVKVKGKQFQCVTGLGNFKPGDLCVYIPPDTSVLSDKLCALLWPEGSKISKPSGNRLKTIKIRKALSEGICLNLNELVKDYPELKKAKLGDDVAKIIGVTKWEPPANFAGNLARYNSKFKKYTDLQNIKHFPDLFEEGEFVVVTEKVHGCCARFGMVAKEKLSILEKIKKFFGLRFNEFCVGSRNVHLKWSLGNQRLFGELGTTNDNVYSRTAKRLNLEHLLSPGEILYGEIYGSTVQKGFHYGLAPGEIGFVAFDLMRDGQYVPYAEFVEFCSKHNIPTAPLLYVGLFYQRLVDEYTPGVSVLHKSQKIREGIVIKSAIEERSPVTGRKILKSINPEYLMIKDLTEYQ